MKNLNKVSLICGITMALCGIIIIVLNLLDSYSTYSLLSGAVFTVAGLLYIVISRNNKQKQS